VYTAWNRACNLCSQHAHADICALGWQELVCMLASLQRFANSLPVPLKPRARELVDPALVSVIQARALGRTFSLTQRRDVSDEVVTDRSVAQALCIGLHDVNLSRLFEDVVAQSPLRVDTVHQRRGEQRDGSNTNIGLQDCYEPSDENKGSDSGYSGHDCGDYEEIYATAGTEAEEEEEEVGREVEREVDDDAHGAPPAKRQRSGTQGSNDEDVCDESFADEFIY